MGDKFKMQDNIKLRPLIDMLLNHSSIKQFHQKPVVLPWLGNDAVTGVNASGSKNLDVGVNHVSVCGGLRDDGGGDGDKCILMHMMYMILQERLMTRTFPKVL